MKRLLGHVTLLTGGGKGIGYGLAEAFAEQGSNLVITGRTESRLVAAKEKLEAAYGIEVLPIVADGADEQAIKNSLCRAISGGPIYVSDKIGRTNPEILKPLCMEDGRIIRPDESATPTADCLMQNPTTTNKIFKLRNRFGDRGVCAVFNINAENKPVNGTLSPMEVGIADGDYIYYEYFTKESGVLEKGKCIDIGLNNNDEYRLYSFIPYNDSENIDLGRTDKFMGTIMGKSPKCQ